MLTIVDIVPSTVRKTPAGIPCPTHLAALMESSAVCFSAGSVRPVAINGPVLLAAIAAAFPGKSRDAQCESVGGLFNGFPRPSGAAPVGSLHSLRALKPRLDANTTDAKTKQLLGKAKHPGKYVARTRALISPDLKTCQYPFHKGLAPATTRIRVAMCTVCMAQYQFKKPGEGHMYYSVAALSAEPRVWAHVRSIFKGSLEALCGYIAVCKSQTRLFAVTADLPVDVLEQIGLQAMLHVWAVAYPIRTYSAVRLLHFARPAVASDISAREPIRAESASYRWWRTVEERGWTNRPVEVHPRQSVWGAPVSKATGGHVVTWTDKMFFSVAALSVIAAVEGMHPRVRCSVRVEVTLNAASPSTLPRIRVRSAAKAIVQVPSVNGISWRYVWRTLQKAVDARDALFTARPVLSVTLELQGNPLAPLPPRPRHEAWTAFETASNSMMPQLTRACFQWLLGSAAAVEAADDVCAANMYPATQVEFEALLANMDTGFKKPEDRAAVAAAMAMFVKTDA